VFAWIEGCYDVRRLHSTLGSLAPADYENSTTGVAARKDEGVQRLEQKPMRSW
jgi:hypothetical protein